MRGKGSEAVDVHSQLNTDQVAFLDVGRVLGEGSIVTAYLVGADCGGEGQALEGGLLVVDLPKLLVDLTVGPETQFEHLRAHCDFFQQSCEHL